jgi:hypothetical protein
MYPLERDYSLTRSWFDLRSYLPTFPSEYAVRQLWRAYSLLRATCAADIRSGSPKPEFIHQTPTRFPIPRGFSRFSRDLSAS